MRPAIRLSRDVRTRKVVRRRVGTTRVTLADVARRAGVSQTAASFVLSGRREEMRISADVEARVRKAARETGYRPNIVSRSLRTGTSHTIGFVSDTVATTPFAGHLIWGALDAARERGNLLFIGETEGDRDLEQQLIEAMHDRGVDGIVLASMYTREITVPRGLTHGPAVLLNAVPANGSTIPSVVPDEVERGPHGRTCPSRRRPPRRDRAHRRGTTKPSAEGQPRRDPTTPGNHRVAQRGRRRASQPRSLFGLAARDRVRRDRTVASRRPRRRR